VDFRAIRLLTRVFKQLDLATRAPFCAAKSPRNLRDCCGAVLRAQQACGRSPVIRPLTKRDRMHCVFIMASAAFELFADEAP